MRKTREKLLQKNKFYFRMNIGNQIISYFHFPKTYLLGCDKKQSELESNHLDVNPVFAC